MTDKEMTDLLKFVQDNKAIKVVDKEGMFLPFEELTAIVAELVKRATV